MFSLDYSRKVLGVTTPLVVMNDKYMYSYFNLSPHIIMCHHLYLDRVSKYFHINEN